MTTIKLSKTAVIELKTALKDPSSSLRKTLSISFARGMFQRIHDAFMVKARGGADDQGLQWEPLKRSTIASRRIQGQESLAFSRRARKGRGLLTAAQTRKWNGIFSNNLTRLSQHMSINAAAAKAASIAWGIIKKEGGETREDRLGDRNVEIMIASGRLEKSLRPGRMLAGSYGPFNQDQVFELTDDYLKLGTSVPYAEKAHKTRKLWPSNVTPWIRSSIREALGDVIRSVASGVRK